ncbi:MAG: hypothetical protein F2947_00870 [Actinobacteria bacterium]|uniref:Unannotated protein n=1 Tax=freshwater metagenome TaxID=449393 RepID=A0A6J7JIV8_9ZZZZ|nr:hypothetical protein [Actinomycetota bacterium]MSW31438.1 hypothetical protein [Actinomycetota bacterium]MSX33629.1 hypothetical protein [Actinomycetota bacterium]MSX94963.1 hypothetical protein [Actinomycetota bacterium]MSY24500.1 hypothetical protein [Actinomycetota bacterium]
MKLRSLLGLTLVGTVLAAGSFVSIDQRQSRATSVVDFGHVGPVAVAAWGEAALTPTTMIPLSSELEMTFGFRTDRAELERRAIAVSDPKSPEYGKYESIAKNARELNASDQKVEAFTNWMTAHNVHGKVDPTHSYATANVPLSVLQVMMNATYGAYAVAGVPAGFVALTPTTAVDSLVSPLDEVIDRVAGATVIWNTTSNTQVPTSVSPESNVGNFSPTSAPVFQPAYGGTPWRTGSPTDACAAADSVAPLGFPMGLSPAQLRTANGIDRLWDAGFRGKGARIAILDFNTYLPSDITEWRDCFGLHGTPVTNHLIGTPVFNAAASDETTLDIQTVLSLAPEADRIDWFGVEPTATSLMGQYLQLFTAPLHAALTGGIAPDALTASFGNCEVDMAENDPAFEVGLSIFDQMLATAVASGIGAFVSSGDTGSTGCYPNGPGTPNNTISAQFPASSRWVTAVGGTNLTLSTDNRIVSSGVWNDRYFHINPLPQNEIIGSGSGGLSLYERRQSWQPRFGAGTHRPVPDISAFADELPGYFLFYQGAWGAVGGTSASAPFTATAFALQSTARVAHGGSRLGFVAPLLYQIAENGGADAERAILDITLGNNDAHEVGVYRATVGYDMASGLGTVRHDGLYDILNPIRPEEPVEPKFTG